MDGACLYTHSAWLASALRWTKQRSKRKFSVPAGLPVVESVDRSRLLLVRGRIVIGSALRRGKRKTTKGSSVWPLSGRGRKQRPRAAVGRRHCPPRLMVEKFLFSFFFFFFFFSSIFFFFFLLFFFFFFYFSLLSFFFF